MQASALHRTLKASYRNTQIVATPAKQTIAVPLHFSTGQQLAIGKHMNFFEINTTYIYSNK
jgi:hypothetical protein